MKYYVKYIFFQYPTDYEVGQYILCDINYDGMSIFDAVYRQSILKSYGRNFRNKSKICAKIASVPAIHNRKGKLRFLEAVYISLLLIPLSNNISIFGSGAIPVEVRGYFVNDHEFMCDRHIKFSLHLSRFPTLVLTNRDTKFPNHVVQNNKTEQHYRHHKSQ